MILIRLRPSARVRPLLRQVRGAEPTRWLGIVLRAFVAGRLAQDVKRRAGDRLLVPPRSKEATVLGQVHRATSHFHSLGLDRVGYIQRSGGITKRADSRRIYVANAHGEVIAGAGSRWFSRADGGSIDAGDMIMAPLNTGRVRPRLLWLSVTHIVYNLAIAAAAVNSF